MKYFKIGFLLLSLSMVSLTSEARQLQARGSARTSVHRPASTGGGVQRPANRTNTNRTNNTRNVNRQNTNVHNTNVNVNRDVNVNVDSHGGGYCCGSRGYYDDYHPIATTVAVTAAATLTSYAIGAMLKPSQVPSSGCVTVAKNGVSYMQCGTTWLEPQYQGSNVTYIVVAPP